MTGGFGSMRTVRGILVAASLLLGCATARAYKTEAFEMTLGDSTSVIEKRGPQGPEWRFAEPNGPEFLGAARYPFLDSRHFEPGDRNSPGGGWYFEQGSTGTIFLSVRGYPRNPHAPARCESGPVIELNGTCAFRCRDTDGLEPYPGPSNVTVTVPVDAGERGRFVLQFEYDEHAPTAHLAEATLESVRVHNPGSNACAR